MKSQSKAEKKAAGTSHTSSRADGRSVTWSDEDLRQEGPSLWQVQRALASLLSKVRSEVINVHLVYELSHACDQKRCEHRKNVVNTVDVFLVCKL